MVRSLPQPAAESINVAKGLFLEAKDWVGSKLDRGSAEYSNNHNHHHMPNQALKDSLSHLPSFLRKQTSGWRSPIWLLPSFIQERINPKPRSKSTSSKISSLDGLRGLACLMVIHMHWTFAVTDSNEGGSAEINTKYLFHRPFFYLFWAGSSHVKIFFVMSGYVLSIKCLKMIHAGQPIQNIITSAVFRRAIRIFLPPLILLFIYLVSIRLGVFDKSNVVWEDNRYWHRYQIRMFESSPPVLPTFSEQLWDILGAAERLMDPSTQFVLPEYGKYDTHLWTMPTEYYCSMALYVVLLATCRLYSSYRLTLHALLVIWCWSTSHQTHALFFAGMTIAEFDVLFKRSIDQKLTNTPTPATPIRMTANSHTRIVSTTTNTLHSPLPLRSYLSISNILCTTSTLSGLYLLSMPLLFAEDTPPYDYLLTFMPAYMSIGQQGEALRALGALLTVWPITFLSATSPCNPLTSTLLANPVSTYLGQISFALYLCHGFVIRSLGYVVLPHIYLFVLGFSPSTTLEGGDPPQTLTRLQVLAPQALGDVTFDGIPDFADSVARLTGWEIGAIWILGYLVVLPGCVWMADLFWRGVDVRCVRLGRWVEERMVMKEGEGEGGGAVRIGGGGGGGGVMRGVEKGALD